MTYADLISMAIEKRSHLFDDTSLDSFRLFNSSGDGLEGLTIDLYGEYLLVQFFYQELFQSERKNAIVHAVRRGASSLPVSIKGILLKNRCKADDGDDITDLRRSILLEGDPPPRDYPVMQNGIKIAVDLVESQNTGLFMDMREARDRLKGLYDGMESLLNMFCYTGAFSVHARTHGCGAALNVDISRPALNRAKYNYELNGIVAVGRDFICDDSFRWMSYAVRKKMKFSMIIFDPPTFSRNKKKTFSIKKNYREALERLTPLAPDGFAFTSINSESATEGDYVAYHPRGWKRIFYVNESSDFAYKNRPYLKAGLWRIEEYPGR